MNSLTNDLRTVLADLQDVNPWLGLGRFASLGILFLSLVGLAWTAPTLWGLVGYGAIAGIIYTFWLICTHDTAHYTLTGWQWFDRWVPCVISYPMLWPYQTYAQLHRLHHAWNGIDLRDPERVQWTVTEYQQAQPWQQWYVRHQWSVDILGAGGLGLIAKTALNGWRFRQQVPALRQALLIDGLGILCPQTGFAIAAILHHRLGDYMLFWLVLERVIGIMVQTRDHLEHYGMWNMAKGHVLTQLYACRNLQVSPLVAWLMGGLNDHAIHHAFPQIPFNHLPEALRRTQIVLEQHQLPAMAQGAGYIPEALKVGSHPFLIAAKMI